MNYSHKLWSDNSGRMWGMLVGNSLKISPKNKHEWVVVSATKGRHGCGVHAYKRGNKESG